MKRILLLLFVIIGFSNCNTKKEKPKEETKIESLFLMLADGSFKDVEELETFISEGGIDELYELIEDGTFSNKNAFKDYFSETEKRLVKINYPKLFPSKFVVKSSSHNIVLNTNLFDTYELKKNTTAILKDSISVKNFPYYSKFIELLKKSEYSEPQTYGSKDKISFDLSFECDDCKTAYLFRTNFNQSKMEEDLIEFLQDPSSNDFRLKKENNKYYYKDKYGLRIHGSLGFYIVLQDYKDKLWIYEFASLNSDGSSPEFSESEYCSFKGNEDYDGKFCVVTKPFEGNDYSGYYVPLKGKIFGDIAKISIDGKNIKVKKGEFYKKLKMKLSTGYNQVPIVLTDNFGNINETYIEITMERIKKDPNIKIDNNIDIDNN